jgi:phosphotransferase system HPr-like phosphotransfer protein
VAPTLTGLPGAIVTAVSQVVEDVAKYLSQVPTTETKKTLNADQKMKLMSLHVRALDVVKRARAIKH